MNYFDQRRAGILLHLSSLPGQEACGTLGQEAYNFIDFLANIGCSVWQMLPIGPTVLHSSPYQLSSIHAGNPIFIDLKWLQQRGWLPLKPPISAISDIHKHDFIAQSRLEFIKHANSQDHNLYEQFINKQAYWLDDYVLFQALHLEFDTPWWEWSQPIRNREPQALAEAQTKYVNLIATLKYEQFIFALQWLNLKKYANQKGILLFGDMPIFVAQDSAEVWAQPKIFDLDARGLPKVVAGVPPDYFSATGQRWGNPLYNWERMQEDNFTFWMQRMRTQLDLFDIIRIDHFRGLESYWAIPATEVNAVKGNWLPAPGDALFTELQNVFGTLPLVAEDLGIITPAVNALRQRYALPGMKVLQFAFYGDATNPYLPFNHTVDSVVYTGTHDNDTSLGWYQQLDTHTKNYVDEFLGVPQESMPWPLIRTALGSVARLAIIPMQDILALDSQHRMNTPGTVGGNWSWRFQWDWIPDGLAYRIKRMVSYYGRHL
ncbi:4-alpha-glucanotransferase [Achromatium sp. WMS3]|nr:4-alpha-glucanotransferase [Achromatium sp. WMS3]